MKVINVYNHLILPNSTMYLRGENAKSIDGSYLAINDEVVFIVTKKRSQELFEKGNLYKIGVIGVVVDIKNGLTVVETKNRVKK